MENFENQLEQIEIPQDESLIHKAKLRNELESAFFAKNTYKQKFHFSSVTAIIFSFLLLGFIAFPQLPAKINYLVFHNNNKKADIFNDQKQMISNPQLQFTSIENPSLINQIDPSIFTEDKAFLVRKYNSNSDGSVVIVSEFENGFSKPKIQNRSM